MTQTLIAQEKPFTVPAAEIRLNPHISPQSLARLPRPYPWSLVTGPDFARSIRAARARGNPVMDQIRQKLSALSHP